MLLTYPPTWTLAAACAGLATASVDYWAPDDELPTSDRGFQLHLARRICATCPVQMECLTDELGRLTEVEPVAMRGALTPEELTDLARDLGIPHRRGPVHGKRSTYVAGCRCSRCRNAHRVYEHERRLRAVPGQSRRRVRAPRPARVGARPQSAKQTVLRRLTKSGRTARSIAVATGLKAKVVRGLLAELEQTGTTARIGVSSQGAPLWIRASASGRGGSGCGPRAR